MKRHDECEVQECSGGPWIPARFSRMGEDGWPRVFLRGIFWERAAYDVRVKSAIDRLADVKP